MFKIEITNNGVKWVWKVFDDGKLIDWGVDAELADAVKDAGDRLVEAEAKSV